MVFVWIPKNKLRTRVSKPKLSVPNHHLVPLFIPHSNRRSVKSSWLRNSIFTSHINKILLNPLMSISLWSNKQFLKNPDNSKTFWQPASIAFNDIFKCPPYCVKLAIKSKLAVCFIQNFDITEIEPFAIHIWNLNEIKRKQSKI